MAKTACFPACVMSSRPDVFAVPPPADWVEVSLTLPPEDLEQASVLLERVAPAGCAVAWVFHQDDDFEPSAPLPEAPARISCYVAPAVWERMGAPLRAWVAEAVWSCAAPQVRTRPLRQAEWEAESIRHRQPLRVGRILVRPPGLTEPLRAGEVLVLLEPGLAFGTGEHESTRMALSAVSTRMHQGQRVLDFGAGSGILACAAGVLGAARVDALDSDPQAVAAAQSNVERNGLTAVVRVWQADQPPRGAYDLVVANLTARILEVQADALVTATRPGGVCILGGIMASQVSRVERVLHGTRLNRWEIVADGEWRTLLATRPAHLSG